MIVPPQSGSELAERGVHGSSAVTFTGFSVEPPGCPARVDDRWLILNVGGFWGPFDESAHSV